ncbi:NUMOD4 motif-containing HNH endonuclease (plasmid) [Fructilactobacillus ixorae]|uniref:NUMOD4 motif-containing HNH endonuclease n=1 Tax=Fructilactobacillus ixorae TaxID=1750535 RepID=A0ABY5C9E9_9LACO|nr:NUMOD4 domain-containing protein [Fructilactobacillus ixorae]USS93985.1 NUMOD4 motif-containing HNH endonuclease [Fructilactobacillus ixorae]
MPNMEILKNFKEIPDYDGKYWINENGEVLSFQCDASGRFNGESHFLKPLQRKYGSLVVSLCMNGKVRQYKANRLVADLFDRNKKFDNLPNEKWKQTEFPNVEVSNKGRLRTKGQFYDAQSMAKIKYKIINVSTNGRYLMIHQGNNREFVHRLVAKAFCPNPNNYNVVNHKDENIFNNNADNLEWCTQKYNANYGTVRQKIAWKRCKPVIGINGTKVSILKNADNGIRNNMHGWSKSSRGLKWSYLKFNFDSLKEVKLDQVSR